MESVVAVRECMWCHEPYYLSDGRYKYCSDECAEKAWLARAKNYHKSKKFFKIDEDIALANEWEQFCKRYRRARYAKK